MSVFFLSKFKKIDLTHELNNISPTWSTNCGFRQTVIVDYEEACRVHLIEMNAGAGTHMDAPLHFKPSGKSIADISLDELMSPLCVIDVSDKVHDDYYISVEDVLKFEEKFGEIKPKSFVVGYTGWDQFWHDPSAFRNVDENGQMHFPGFSKEAAELLLERDIVGIGLDSLSPDCLDLSFPVHHLILGAGKYIVENLANCGGLPPIGGFIIVLPLKITDGSESGVRAVAFV